MNLESVLVAAVVGLLLGGFTYIKRLQNALKNKEGELAQEKVEGEVKVHEERIKEATKRAARSLEFYRKLKSARDGSAKKPD